MRDNAVSFVGDVPGEYDQGLGPIVFADYAVDMARRVAVARPMRVLEMAAGKIFENLRREHRPLGGMGERELAEVFSRYGWEVVGPPPF